MSLYEEIKYVWDDNKVLITNKVGGWAGDIAKNKEKIRTARRSFRAWKPFRVYVSTTKAKKSGAAVEFSIRYCGQQVADLIVSKKQGVLLDITSVHAGNNQNYFNVRCSKGRYAWDGAEAKRFRADFKKIHKETKGLIKTGIPEHKVESKLIEEMEKKTRKKFKGNFSGIQPVMIEGCPFQVPTPISGNSGVPKLTDGNVDILARRRCKDNRVRLSVWELKKPKTFAKAVDQVYIYAVTLLFVLRSKHGQKWYKLFGFNRKIPKKLEIEAVVAVTKDQRNKFEKRLLQLKKDTPLSIGNDSIRFSVAYYDATSFMIDSFHEVL